MVINIQRFKLEIWRKNNLLADRPLGGSNHEYTIQWLTEVFRDLGFKKAFKYVSCKQGDKQISTDEFSIMKSGRWINHVRKGAVNDASGKTQQDIIKFFNAAINRYIK